jgi:hypothetical protein
MVLEVSSDSKEAHSEKLKGKEHSGDVAKDGRTILNGY